MSESEHPEHSEQTPLEPVPGRVERRLPVYRGFRVQARPVPAWTVVLVLVGVVVFSAAAGFSANEIIRHNGQKSLVGSGAVESWRAKVARDPQDVPSRLGLAYALEVSGQLDLALAEYDDVLRDDPRDIAALYGLGSVQLKLQQPEEAEASLWAVLEQDEGHVRAAGALGEYYAGKRQFRSLVRAVRPAATAHPTEARLQYLMGFAYENLGRPDWAAARYRLALAAVPDMAESLDGLRRLEPTH